VEHLAEFQGVCLAFSLHAKRTSVCKGSARQPCIARDALAPSQPGSQIAHAAAQSSLRHRLHREAPAGLCYLRNYLRSKAHQELSCDKYKQATAGRGLCIHGSYVVLHLQHQRSIFMPSAKAHGGRLWRPRRRAGCHTCWNGRDVSFCVMACDPCTSCPSNERNASSLYRPDRACRLVSNVL
jgi:hypothetical protein